MFNKIYVVYFINLRCLRFYISVNKCTIGFIICGSDAVEFAIATESKTDLPVQSSIKYVLLFSC